MTENLRIMSNRMVLLNPLVSLLKKNNNSVGAPSTAGHESVTSNRGIPYVKSDGEEADGKKPTPSIGTRGNTGYTNRKEGDEVIVD